VWSSGRWATRSASGIGNAPALRLADEGAAVLVTDIQVEATAAEAPPAAGHRSGKA
jgi:NAD(P)-dependent dehydrogenase (short-subunit alcohol dehydrogenase family)